MRPFFGQFEHLFRELNELLQIVDIVLELGAHSLMIRVRFDIFHARQVKPSDHFDVLVRVYHDFVFDFCTLGSPFCVNRVVKRSRLFCQFVDV